MQWLNHTTSPSATGLQAHELTSDNNSLGGVFFLFWGGGVIFLASHIAVIVIGRNMIKSHHERQEQISGWSDILHLSQHLPRHLEISQHGFNLRQISTTVWSLNKSHYNPDVNWTEE